MKVVRTKPYYKGVTSDLRSPSQSTGKLTYTEGTTVEADGIDTDPDRDCGQGINFVGSIAEALRWGPVVVEVRVPKGITVVDTGTKLRRCEPRRCVPRPCVPHRCVPRPCEPHRCEPHRCVPHRCGPRRCVPRRCEPRRCVPHRGEGKPLDHAPRWL